MITNGNDLHITELKRYLNQWFEMKDFDHLTYFFELEVISYGFDYFFTQAKYGTNLTSQERFINAKITSTRRIVRITFYQFLSQKKCNSFFLYF